MKEFYGTIERRQKPDGVLRLVTFISTIGWLLVILCSLLTIYAKPEQTNMFYEMFNIPIRNYWDYSFLGIVFILLICLLALSLFGIFMNSLRNRRKTDRIRRSLIFQAIASVIGIILLLIDSIL